MIKPTKIEERNSQVKVKHNKKSSNYTTKDNKTNDSQGNTPWDRLPSKTSKIQYATNDTIVSFRQFKISVIITNAYSKM